MKAKRIGFVHIPLHKHIFFIFKLVAVERNIELNLAWHTPRYDIYGHIMHLKYIYIGVAHTSFI